MRTQSISPLHDLEGRTPHLISIPSWHILRSRVTHYRTWSLDDLFHFDSPKWRLGMMIRLNVSGAFRELSKFLKRRRHTNSTLPSAIFYGAMQWLTPITWALKRLCMQFASNLARVSPLIGSGRHWSYVQKLKHHYSWEYRSDEAECIIEMLSWGSSAADRAS